MTDGLWLPGYERVRGMTAGHPPRVPSAPIRCVLHTDEISGNGSRRRIAQRHPNPPQLWVTPAIGERLQLIDLNRTGKALRRDTRLETNHMGRRCVQVEIGARAAETHRWPDEWIEWVALEVILPIHQHAGVPLATWRPYGGGDAYGTDTRYRMSGAQWAGFSGFCGHQHVPGGNAHWDPGLLPVERMLDIARDHLGQSNTPPPPSTGDDDDMTPEQAQELADTRREVAEMRRALLAGLEVRGVPTGAIDLGTPILNAHHLIVLMAAEANKGGDPRQIAEAIVESLGDDLASRLLEQLGKVITEKAG